MYLYFALVRRLIDVDDVNDKLKMGEDALNLAPGAAKVGLPLFSFWIKNISRVWLVWRLDV